MIRNYYKAQGLFGIPRQGQVEYTKVLDLDLGTVRASVAGPKRPQDRIEIDALKPTFTEMLQAGGPNGYNKPASEIHRTARTVVGMDSRSVGVVSGGGDQDMALASARMPNTNQHPQHEIMHNRTT